MALQRHASNTCALQSLLGGHVSQTLLWLSQGIELGIKLLWTQSPKL